MNCCVVKERTGATEKMSGELVWSRVWGRNVKVCGKGHLRCSNEDTGKVEREWTIVYSTEGQNSLNVKVDLTCTSSTVQRRRNACCKRQVHPGRIMNASCCGTLGFPCFGRDSPKPPASFDHIGFPRVTLE